MWREFADRPARVPRPRSWPVFGIVAAVVLLIGYILGQRWQGQIRDLMSAEPESVGSKLLFPLVAVLIFVGLVAAARGIRSLYRWAARRLERCFLPIFLSLFGLSTRFPSVTRSISSAAPITTTKPFAFGNRTARPPVRNK